MVDLAEFLGAGRAYLTEEPADGGQMSDDAPRRQTAFSLEICAEVGEYLVLRSDPRWLGWCDDSSITQRRQESPQCRAVTRVHGPLPGSVPEKLFDHSFIHVGHPEAAASQPINEVTNQTQRSQSDSMSESVFSEARRVALYELPVASVL
jgi:hypothetical protein